MKVALNTYSLRNDWKSLNAKKGNVKVNMIINLCHDLDIDELEILDRDVESMEIKDAMKKFKDAGIHVFSFGPHVKLLEKPNAVDKQIKDAKKWIELAASLDVPYLRFQVGNGPLMRAFPPMDDFTEEEWQDYYESIDEAINFSAAVVDPVIELAEKNNVKIGIETHHSYSSNYVYMKKFNERWDSKNIGWIFDIGNYENDDLRWKGLEVIKHRVFYIHAKAYKFDKNGFEKTLDYPKAAKILKDAGFDGNWSIEFEGKMNGILGAYRTAELVRYSIAKAEGRDYTMKKENEFPSEKALIKKYKQK
ncbi:MAG: sugar phosphate isomerase/epimerase family protein [Promethearchaeota archaeon]